MFWTAFIFISVDKSAELSLFINSESIPAYSQKALIHFLSDPPQGYRLEMSTDEMAMLFLRFLEKD